MRVAFLYDKYLKFILIFYTVWYIFYIFDVK